MTASGGQDGVGVAFRVQDVSNYWSLQTSNSTSPKVWNLYKTQAGVATVVGTTPSGLCCAGHRVSVRFQGAAISVTVDGASTPQLTATDPNSALRTATQVGLLAAIKGAGRFGDFVTYASPISCGLPCLLPNVVTREYDANGNTLATTDGDGHEAGFTYDLAGQLTQTDTPGASQSTEAVEGYDANGNHSSHSEKIGSTLHTTNFVYGNPGYPAAMASMSRPPIGGASAETTQYSYDARGMPQTKLDALSRTTTYVRDAAGQETSITYSDGTTPNVTGITYDAVGHRTALGDGDGNGASGWTWDSLGRQRSSTVGSTGTVAYGYDLADHETTIGYPSAGTLTRTFDDAGRLTQLTDWKSTNNVTGFGYDANDNLTSVTYPNGVATTISPDPANQPLSYSHALGATTLGSFIDFHTATGRTNLTINSGVADTGALYGYDARAQITGNTQGANPYTYDNANNPTRLTDGTYQGFNEADELCWRGATNGSSCTSTPSGDETFTYDHEGNRTTHSLPNAFLNQSYSYDSANRMTTVGAFFSGVTYGYNADNLRTTRTYSGGWGTNSTNFTWNTSRSLPTLLQETTSGTTTNYIYGSDGQVLQQLTGTTPTYLQHDQQGSTRLLTNATGTVTATYSYDPYGRVPAGWKTGSATTPVQYAGQYTDTETGFQYLRQRYYDPNTSQFVTRDPLEAATGAPYTYAGNDPLNLSDPTGLDFWDDTGLSDAWDDAQEAGSFVIEHRGEIADVLAGGVCVATAGAGCLLAVGGAALISSEQTVQTGIERGDSLGTILGDTGVSILKSGALAVPGLAEYAEAETAIEATAFFEAHPFISTVGWDMPRLFEYGSRFVTESILTLPSSIELYRALNEAWCGHQ